MTTQNNQSPAHPGLATIAQTHMRPPLNYALTLVRERLDQNGFKGMSLKDVFAINAPLFLDTYKASLFVTSYVLQKPEAKSIETIIAADALIRMIPVIEQTKSRIQVSKATPAATVAWGEMTRQMESTPDKVPDIVARYYVEAGLSHLRDLIGNRPT